MAAPIAGWSAPLGGPSAMPKVVTGVFGESARTLQNAVEAGVGHDQNAHVGLLPRWSTMRTPPGPKLIAHLTNLGNVSLLLQRWRDELHRSSVRDAIGWRLLLGGVPADRSPFLECWCDLGAA